MANRVSDNTFRGARNLLVNGRGVRDLVGQKDRVDFYKFTASSQANFSLRLSGLRGNVSLRLLNANRVPIAASNRPGNQAEQINRKLNPGTYYVEVRFLNRRGSTSYSLQTTSTPIPSPPNPPTPPNPPVGDGDDSLTTASNIGVLTTTYIKQNTVGASDSADFYKFTLNDIANLQIRTTGSEAGTRFSLIRDANNNELLDNSETLASDASFGANVLADATQDLPPGTYFLKVESTSVRATGYQLNLIPALFGGNLSPEPGNTLPFASNLGVFSGTRSVKEYVGTLDESDFYKFTLNDLANLQINALGSSSPVRVRLIRDANDNGLVDTAEIFATREGSGTVTPANLNTDLPVGTYFIQVNSRFGTSPTSYEMNLVGTPFGGSGLPDPGNSLQAARDLGILSGTVSLKEYVGVLDSSDVYKFTINTSLNFRATSSASIDLDLVLIRDTNGNGFVDAGESLRSGVDSLNSINLQAGTYFVSLEPRFTGNFSSNYELNLIST